MSKQKKKQPKKGEVDPRLVKADKDVKELLEETPLLEHETPFEQEMRVVRSGKPLKGKRPGAK